MKKYPPRPTHDFTLSSVKWQVKSEATHRQAGFPEVPFDVIQRRFRQLLEFLAERGYLLDPTLAQEVGLDTVLMNASLTDEGYLFVQRYEDKWTDRLHKDKGAEAERKFLEKWHAQFLAERAGA